MNWKRPKPRLMLANDEVILTTAELQRQVNPRSRLVCILISVWAKVCLFFCEKDDAGNWLLCLFVIFWIWFHYYLLNFWIYVFFYSHLSKVVTWIKKRNEIFGHPCSQKYKHSCLTTYSITFIPCKLNDYLWMTLYVNDGCASWVDIVEYLH